MIPANIRINFTSPETRRIVLPDAENRTIIRLDTIPERDGRTDGQTERQTDRQNPSSLYSASALRAMRTRCKNDTLSHFGHSFSFIITICSFRFNNIACLFYKSNSAANLYYAQNEDSQQRMNIRVVSISVNSDLRDLGNGMTLQHALVYIDFSKLIAQKHARSQVNNVPGRKVDPSMPPDGIPRQWRH